MESRSSRRRASSERWRTKTGRSPASAISDIDGGGRSDIVWRNSTTGLNYLYPMNGALILAGESYLRTVSDLNWKIVGLGDLDGDGKADILWRNSATGENYLYPMVGAA